LIWIEEVGDIIVGHLTGVPDDAMLKDCYQQILALAKSHGQRKVLIDVRDMEPPSLTMTLGIRDFAQAGGTIPLRRAIVVPNSRMAYLARLALGDSDYRVFYGDAEGAIKWLAESAE